MNLWRIDGDAVKLAFHSGQDAAWQSDKRFIFVLAGTQGGKTSFGPWWLNREIQRCGPGDYLAVTSSFDLFKLKMLPEIRSVFEHLLHQGRWWAGDKVLELCDPSGKFWANKSGDPMWGRIILRSAQSEGGLESATAKAAWLDECGQAKFNLADWEAVLRRLSLAQGRVLGTTTIYNIGWLKMQVYDRWKAGDPDFDVIQFPSIANPVFPQEEYDRAKRTLPNWKVKMFYEGQFDRPAGMIFDVFNYDLHTVNPFPVPQEWGCAVGVDPIGAVTAGVFLAYDKQAKQLHVYDEYYGHYGKSTEDHADAIHKKYHGTVLIDCTGGALSERQARLDWQQCGVPLSAPPFADVESGIMRIYGLLKTRALIIHRNCTHLIDELGSYSRKLDKNDEPTEAIEDKNDFHCIDALRYIIASLTTSAKGQIRIGRETAIIGERRY